MTILWLSMKVVGVRVASGVQTGSSTAVVTRSGSDELTEPMIAMGLRFAETLAGAELFPADAAALRGI